MLRIELGSPGIRRADPTKENQEDGLSGLLGQRITSDAVILTRFAARKLDCPELVFNQSLFDD